MALINLDKDNFNSLIENGICVADFYASWCGPCKMLTPIIEKVSKEVDATFIKVDVDKYDELARSYGIMNIPTIIIFKDGKQVRKNIGFISEDKLKTMLDEV